MGGTNNVIIIQNNFFELLEEDFLENEAAVIISSKNYVLTEDSKHIPIFSMKGISYFKFSMSAYTNRGSCGQQVLRDLVEKETIKAWGKLISSSINQDAFPISHRLTSLRRSYGNLFGFREFDIMMKFAYEVLGNLNKQEN